MMFINFFLVGLLTTGLEIRCSTNFCAKKGRTFLLNSLFTNLFSLVILRFLLEKQQLFQNETYTWNYSFKYLLLASVVGISYLFIKYLIHHSSHLKACPTQRAKKDKIWLGIHSFIFAIAWFFLVFASRLSLMTTDAITKGEWSKIIDTELLLYLLGITLFISFLWAPFHVVYTYRTPITNQTLQRVGGTVSNSLLIISIIYTFTLLFS